MFILLALLTLHVAPQEKSASDVSHAIVLKLSDAPAREVSVTLDLISPERTWSVPVKTKGAKFDLVLVHPPCACTLRARADEYAEATRPLGDENSLLLRRLPAIRGVVLDGATVAPLAGADVEVPGSKTRTITDARGAFRLVIDDVWPASLRIDHPMRAPAFVAVPRAVADTDLPPIRLSVGGAIQLNVAPPVGGAETLSWEIRKDDKSASLVRSGELRAGTSSARIDALEPATYHVLLKGSEPLQRYVGKARVIERVTTEANVVITPLVVEGKVTFDGAPLSSASISVSSPGSAWIAKFDADDEGRFTEELWQAGTYKIGVTREPLVHIWGVDRELDGDGRVDLELAIPNRRVHGRVLDARGEPVGDARVSAKMKFGERDVIVNRAQTAIDGTFEFTGVEAGNVTLSVAKGGYRAPPSVTFILGDDEMSHEENLILDRLAIERSVVVTDGRGFPVAGAEVLMPSESGYAPVATTDDQGRATIHLASARDRGMVFVIPRSGSIGYAPIATDGAIAVRVLDGSALDLQIESVDGEPIPRVIVMMSINGTSIPPDIVAHMARIQGFPLYSDARGHLSYPRMPPGQYELWPLASKKDSQTPAPPVRVAVMPGAQTVVMKFKPK
ncbi:MAG TPA: carboxypeptidase regulatory-like domain-containing protein [Thermoanaerobaculia bacterium]|nr:carboxypeptidase regulatory-like domain-containing protein [Thermoanaerobaculia bacterium]